MKRKDRLVNILLNGVTLSVILLNLSARSLKAPYDEYFTWQQDYDIDVFAQPDPSNNFHFGQTGATGAYFP